MPADPVQRAKVRFFIDAAAIKLQAPLTEFFMKGGSADAVLAVLEDIQSLLPAGGTFAVGDHITIADIALAPILRRLEMAVKNNNSAFSAEEGKRVSDAWQDGNLVRLRKYFEGIKSRDSFSVVSSEVK